MKRYRTLEQSLLFLVKQAEHKIASLSINELLTILSGKGQPLLLIILSLPFCQPIQIPGMSTPFGLIIALIGLKMTFNKRIWLPEKILKKRIASQTIRKIADKVLWLINKTRHFIYPRLVALCRNPIMKKINGLLITLLGLYLALPLPIPLSNLVAAWPALLIALGISKDDGLFVLLGYLIAFLAIIAFFIIAFQIDWTHLYQFIITTENTKKN